MGPRPTGQVRVGDICAHRLLGDATRYGPTTLRSTSVTAIDLVVPSEVMAEPLTANGVVVLALDAQSPDGHRGHLIDVVLRRAAAAGSAAVVVTGTTTPLIEATRELAQQLSMVLLVAESVSSTELVVSLRELVGSPRQQLANILLELAGRLRHPPQRLDELVQLIEEALPGANAYVCAGADLVLAGTPDATRPAEIVGFRQPGELQGDGFGAAILPVEGLSGDVALWLVAERERVGLLWLEAASATLGLCSGAALTWLAREQARHERDARTRSALLAEILESGQGVGREVVQQAARVGWQLEGWHTGVHFRFTPAVPSALTVLTLADQLARSGLQRASLVERTDGWAAWLTSSTEPGPDQAREVARKLEHDLRNWPAGTSVAVGIGSPQRDIAGIAVTLAEARQAALIAAGSPRPLSIRVLQEVGPSRLLLGWYSSEAFSDYATELFAPLISSDEPALLSTLEAYLERACSASHTARALGVHRNTVAQRIAKAERLLGTSTNTADSRLALQLALRVIRTQST